MFCKCTADIYSMKAMAARPAAPKEATSLAPAPVNGLTGLDGLATALVGATGAGALLGATGVGTTAADEDDQAAQVEEAATGVEAELLTEAELEELQAAHVEAELEAELLLLEAELLTEAEVEALVHAAHVPLDEATGLLLVETLTVVEEDLAGADEVVQAVHVDSAGVVVDLAGVVVALVVVATVVVALVVVVTTAVVEELVHCSQVWAASVLTAAAEAAATKPATAMKDFILIVGLFGFCLNE